jgi:hypothetical protein
MSQNKSKIVKFHGLAVENVIIRYVQRESIKPEIMKIEEFNAEKNPQVCETINIQVVSDYITISFYGNESNNEIISRELIPTHTVEHIWVNDIRK